jgi:hypothetical protein
MSNLNKYLIYKGKMMTMDDMWNGLNADIKTRGWTLDNPPSLEEYIQRAAQMEGDTLSPSDAKSIVDTILARYNPNINLCTWRPELLQFIPEFLRNRDDFMESLPPKDDMAWGTQ